MKHKLTFFAVILMAMAIPHSVKAYDISAVAPSGQTLYYDVYNGEAYVTYGDIVNGRSYSNLVGDLIIPSTVTSGAVISYRVVGIRNSAFWNCEGITSVYIPNSVGTRGISCQAFAFCINLTTVTIVYYNGVTLYLV